MRLQIHIIKYQRTSLSLTSTPTLCTFTKSLKEGFCIMMTEEAKSAAPKKAAKKRKKVAKKKATKNLMS